MVRTIRTLLTVDTLLTGAIGIITFFCVRTLNAMQGDIDSLQEAKERQSVMVAQLKVEEDLHYSEIITRLTDIKARLESKAR